MATRTHFKPLCVAEIGAFLSEKSAACGDVAAATPTNAKLLAAKNEQFMNGKVA